MTGQVPIPPTETVGAFDARQQWSRLLTRAYRKEARFVVERSGIPMAAVVSVDDLAHIIGTDALRRALLTPPGPAEIDRRSAIVAETIEARRHRVIAPLDATDLIRADRESSDT